MNTLIFIGMLLFGFLGYAQQGKRTIKVVKIDSTESYYFIRAKFKGLDKGKLLIVSERDTTFKSCKKIKKGKVYELALENYLSEKDIERLPAKKPGTLLLREDGYLIWDGKSDLPYKSPNIKSLYYIKE